HLEERLAAHDGGGLFPGQRRSETAQPARVGERLTEELAERLAGRQMAELAQLGWTARAGGEMDGVAGLVEERTVAFEPAAEPRSAARGPPRASRATRSRVCR